ncbi:hypothetical protein BDF22DRAFT_733842 [Syncephalis plumigaleata]|nr:hypothetical protein BDF22DRAFT_733842 [Syncephalis plumigaleata]
MRITPHSALAISTCALALLSQLPSAHSAGGGVFKESKLFICRETKSTFSKQYVETYKDNLFLSNIRWGGGDGDQLSFARVNWNGHDAFMKCDKASEEVDAFNALKELKRKLEKGELSNDYATGRENVMDPLHQFGFNEAGQIFIEGMNLKDYLKNNNNVNIYKRATKILPDIIKGLMYLYNAGIIYHDGLIHNIMIQLTPTGEIAGVKIIDLDRTIVFKKEDGWQPINLNGKEHLSPNPSQRYNSCNDFKLTLTKFLYMFVDVHTENPFRMSYMNDYTLALVCLNQLRVMLSYYDIRRLTADDSAPPSYAVRAVMAEMLPLVKAIYTLVKDPFACSSPILVLRGLPPRI